MKMTFICLFLMAFTRFSEPDISALRSLYYQAVTDESSFTKLSKLLVSVDTKSPPVLVCYKGATEMIAAKYAINPFLKLGKFKKGRLLIEQAIKRDAEDVEMRFLRFSIQTNLPAFLGYGHKIKDDKDFLINEINDITDQSLKNNVISYLSSSKYCTAEDLKRITK